MSKRPTHPNKLKFTHTHEHCSWCGKEKPCAIVDEHYMICRECAEDGYVNDLEAYCDELEKRIAPPPPPEPPQKPSTRLITESAPKSFIERISWPFEKGREMMRCRCEGCRRTVRGFGYQPCKYQSGGSGAGGATVKKVKPSSNIFQMALNHYGIRHQAGITIEEMAELMVELRHYYERGRGDIKKVCEEIADVKIMVAQMEIATDPELVEAFYQIKMDRLHSRIVDERGGSGDGKAARHSQ